MKKMNRFILILILICSASFSASAENLTGDEIYERAVSASRLDGSEAVSRMVIIDKKGRERIRETAQITKLYNNGKTEKKLIRFLSPADVKGTGFLTFDYEEADDDMWLYMPALRKVRRIVSSEKSKSFMGSEFSYSDMSPLAASDFNINLKGSETIDNEECYVLEMIPLNDDIADENGFTRKKAWIGKNDFVIRKAEFYDFTDMRFKTFIVENVKLVDPEKNKYRPMLLKMENHDNGRKSVLEIKKIVLNRNIGDEYFTQRYLSRE
jgi:outer membrane lipoprotein-sorting protein